MIERKYSYTTAMGLFESCSGIVLMLTANAISKKVAAEEMEFDKDPESMSRRELEKLIGDIQKKMKKAAAELNFEAAAEYRDKMVKLKNMLRDIEE